VRPIVRVNGRAVVSEAVASSTAIRLSDVERLEALRRLDQFREWHSLDDKRHCLVCGELISGQQIKVARGTRGNAELRLNCPTKWCNSIPMDWVRPTDEILAKIERMAAEQRQVSALEPAAITSGEDKAVIAFRERNDFMSRFRNFALYFKRRPKPSRAIPAGFEPPAGPQGSTQSA
jgi:hypothetical protein